MCKSEGTYDVKRKSADVIKLETLYHCCTHSDRKTHADKAVEKGSRTRLGRRGDKRADNAAQQDKQTQTRPGQGKGEEHGASHRRTYPCYW